MNKPPEPIVLAENGRFAVAELGPRVMLFDRGRTPSEVTVLLLAISTLVFGGFGAVSLFTAAGGEFTPRSLVTGALFLGIGIVSFRTMIKANGALHRARRTPLNTVAPLAVFDRESAAYIDGNGEMIAQLSQVRCTATGFGAAKLSVVTPDGPRVVARGNPLSGGLTHLAMVVNHSLSGPGSDE
ncbi:hypothetical protein ACAG24_017340 [Mycobacterium sp. pW049]|uniref:hypothetical protein n=1 Tax=[Mycobacterium] bulgaricum TaxID=3238985 RepID=UPI00351BA596